MEGLIDLSLSITNIALFLILVGIVAGLILILPATIDPKLLELKPREEVKYREKEPEKYIPYSDFVWTDLEGSNTLKFIYDQDNTDGVLLLTLLGGPRTRVQTHLVNGVQHVGIVHLSNLRNSLPNDLLRRKCAPTAFLLSEANITSRRQPLILERSSVLLRYYN